MAESADSSTRAHAGPHAMLTQYLVLRSPARLAVDAAVLLLLAFLFSHFWTATSDAAPLELRSRPAKSLLLAIARPQSVLGTLYSALLYLAWMLFAWAGLRLLAGALAGREE